MSAADLTPEALAEKLGLPRPTAEQSEVIGYPLRPLLVVAGAGSGKTATMSQRVVHLVATGAVRPDQVLGLTFTRKATAELAERVSLRLAQLAASGVIADVDDAPEPTVATYDSFAGSLVRDYGLYVGADPDATLITEARKWQIATDILERRTDPLPIDSLSTATKIVLDADNALSMNLLSIEDASEQLTELHELFAGLVRAGGVGGAKPAKDVLARAPERMRNWLEVLETVQEFRDYKRRHGLVDFGDRLALACRIAEEVPEAVVTMRAQYPAVLLDEFQDTSVAQVRLLSALFADRGVTAVGDPNQAIYGWRGASAGALDTFHERFNPSGTQAVSQGEDPDVHTPVLPLSVAWRNDSAVLAAANVISKPLRSHEYQPGDAEVSHVRVDELQERSIEAGLGAGRVLGAFLADPLQEGETVAEFMRERWSSEAELAILGRTHDQLDVVAKVLHARGVPYEVVGLGGMLSIPEVADVRALLAVAADPERGDRLMRLLTGADIGAADLRALQRFARELARQRDRADGAGADTRPDGDGVAQIGDARAEGVESGNGGGPAEQLEEAALSEALEEIARRDDATRAPGARRLAGERSAGGSAENAGLSEAGRQAALRIARALRRVRGALTLPLPDLVAVAEQALGLDIELAARVGNRMGRRALDAFRAAAEQYAADVETPTVSGFLELLELFEQKEDGLDVPEVAPTPGAVQLMTVHAAKGLEWDCVAVIGLSEKSFPKYGVAPSADGTLVDKSWMGYQDQFPHPLRTDADQLPPFRLGELDVPADVGMELTEDEKQAVAEYLNEYAYALGRHTIAEERRLAYVAITRARHDVLLTGSHLAKTARKPNPMSRFLAELRRRDLVDEFGPGFTERNPDAVNPLSNAVAKAPWPVTHSAAPGSERAARIAAAEAVSRAMAAPAAGGGTGETGLGADGMRDGASSDECVSHWWEEARLLLAERDAAAAETPTVRQPAHLAATRLAALRDDRDQFALDLRRPLPSQPQSAGRLGTVFHEAIAQRLSSQSPLFSLQTAGVPDTLTGSDRRRVERWLDVAANHPLLEDYQLVSTEESLELTVGDTTLRCRIDAVFKQPDTGNYLVVDWKTGHRRVPVDQLSVYVHAWSAKEQVPTDQIRAAYLYVDEPGGYVDELDAESLETLEEIRQSLEPRDQ
ncbi:DNA helicase-2 / ATP-dependent DNA helicase PcrA [Actinomyces ruminicola]|uniref:DNA 3'-5' helicase n=1 Tax=Actinomyces ruminicola TaxID=332524 RepID=A0A1H0C227_9ACTO|nr:ATP-dependent DNA helicase [Actinomyces ruminicola]SDN51889.1 DNA helicase-2 / ATP-dependent DNA helicase PcrA [Actinomyces ruminicola]